VDKGLLEQLPYYLTPAATVLAVILAYVFGRRQTEHDGYTRAARRSSPNSSSASRT
jgi:hypothetical protein